MKILLLVTSLVLCSLANENFTNMKKCEVIKLSKFTTLISCHKVDYLVKYKLQDDEEKDNIKKITVITTKDQKIILGEERN